MKKKNMLWTQKEQKNAEHEKHMKCMQEKLNLSGDIKRGVKKDINRSTRVLSKHKDDKIGLIYRGSIEKELDKSDSVEMHKT